MKKAENLHLKSAYSYYDSGKADSSFYYFNQAKGQFIKEKDSLMIGTCLLYMAMISTDQGDHFGAQEIAIDAIRYFRQKKNNFLYLQSTFNTLDVSSSKLKNYRQAISFYSTALNYAKGTSNYSIIENNIGDAYSDLKDYQKAFTIFNKILLEKPSNEKDYARVLTNLANAKWLQNSTYNAAPELMEAMILRTKINDVWGLNSSYTHLSNYYTETKPDSAIFYANKRYVIAQLINSPDDRLESLKKLIKLAPSTNSEKYFEQFQQLNDSLQTARNDAKNQFALIRYETDKQKTDNLVLQQENTNKKYQLIILISVSFLLLIGGVVWYKKRKQTLALETENTIKENQLKTSKKVHDVLANGLYRIMTKLDHQEILKNDPIVDEIEELYEKSRDISYETTIISPLNFNDKISQLLKAFASNSIKILIVGNELKLWKKLNNQTQHEIEHILQELMVNMKKHSNASNVIIKFKELNKRININYADDGVGMNNGISFNNGLTNTGNRINGIGGTINFESNKEKGLKINISFPIT